MRIQKDNATFDELQLRLKNRIGAVILAALDKARLDVTVADQLCDSIVFAVTSVLDGAHEPVTFEGLEASPRLVFECVSDGGLISSDDGGSSMHEYASERRSAVRIGCSPLE